MPIHVFIGPFLVALAVRFPFMVGAFLDPSWGQAPDSPLYQALAAILFRDGDFPSMFRTPGYPLYLSAWYRLGIPDPAYPVAAQLGIDAFTAGLTAVLAFRVFNRTSTSWLAGLMYALNPNVLFHASKVLPESLFTFLILGAMLMYLHSDRLKRPIPAMVSCAIFVLASYLKPVAAYAPLALAAFSVLPSGKRLTRALRHLALAAIVLVGMTPWIIRNHSRYGIWGFSTAVDVNLMGMSVPLSMAVKRKPFDPRYLIMGVDREATYNEVWQGLKDKYGWEGEKLVAVIPDPSKSPILRREFIEFFKREWPFFFLAQIYGHWMFFRPYSPHPLVTPRLIPDRTAQLVLTVVGFLLDLATFLFFCLAVFRLLYRSRSTPFRGEKGVLLLIVLYLMAAHLHSGEPRLRTHALPYICMLAAGALTTLRRGPKQPRSPTDPSL